MKPENPNSDHMFALFGVGIASLMAYNYLLPKVLYVWSVYKIPLIVSAAASVIMVITYAVFRFLEWTEKATYAKKITASDSTSVLLGRDARGVPVHLKQSFRTSHTQVIGTTNAGKTESIILPWAIRDVETGSGLLIVDGKSDNSFLQKFYAYVVKAGRQKDFRLFSLANIAPSSTFNPLAAGSVQEVSERVFSSFPMDNSYFRAVQSKIFNALLTLIHDTERVPTFTLVYQLLSDSDALTALLLKCPDCSNKRLLTKFNQLTVSEKALQVSGLEANLAHFTQGETALLFNSEKPGIDFDAALNKNLICYFQLPTMYYPYLAESTGKLALQTFQNAVAKRHLSKQSSKKFFSCFLDDFQDYIYEGFAGLLNKSRSANIGVVFSHQALGDLDKVGPHFRNIVSTCTNVKVVMRTNDPDTCEFYAKTIGTKKAEKATERQNRSIFATTKTGEGSVREVDEYIVHPNDIRALGRGQGIVSIPHPRGVETLKVAFQMRANIPGKTLPAVMKSMPALIEPIVTTEQQTPVTT